jgi:hypothetical protein
MFSNSFFGLGAILPIITMLLGYLVIGLIASLLACLATELSNPVLGVQTAKRRNYWPIGVLVCSEILTGVGAWAIRSNVNLGIELIEIGFLIVWPVSAALAFWSRGFTRMVLLIGHGLIAAWVCFIVVIMWLHKLDLDKVK